LSQIDDQVIIWNVDLPLGGDEIRSSIPAKVVNVHRPDDPFSPLDLEFEWSCKLERVPAAEPSQYGSYTGNRDRWSLLDEDGLTLSDPRAAEPPTTESTNVIVYQPTMQGIDTPVPATVLDDSKYPYLDVKIRQTEIELGVCFGTHDRCWSWSDESPPAETVS
jgi:hypothetical protein